ncbi:MAG TPA: IMP dehydrogenase [Candidatus Saccharimonadales bacterium]|nr:IMP dehydrogenase [Candidatus Saccharimonadales bacterium]
MASNKEVFFEHMHGQEFQYFGYSELGMRTDRISQVSVDDISIEGQVSRHYSFKVPIIGAAMNSISEDSMAIAMGELGAGAIIHHANTPKEQKEMVRNVYYHLNGIIDSPLLARDDETVADVLSRLDQKGKTFRTLPVTDADGKCVGLMDEPSFRLFDSQTKVSEAMHPFGTFPTAEAGITPEEVYTKMRDEKLGRLLLVDSDRSVSGLCLDKDIGRMARIRSDPQHFNLTPDGHLITLASIPTLVDEAIERVELMHKYLNIAVIDTSHGNHIDAIDTLKAVEKEFPFDRFGIDFLAGNISTEETGIEVAKYDPDGSQVGQGPGEICISSDRLGIGTPQASAVYEVTKGVHSIDPEIPIIADGGIRDSADTVKALALGATAVKVGNLIAGTDETPVKSKRDELGNPFSEYWGMGSEDAQIAFAAARARYGNYSPLNRIFIEGFKKRVPLKGPVSEVIEDHVLGVKLSMMSMGMSNIAELQEHVSFMRGNNRKN